LHNESGTCFPYDLSSEKHRYMAALTKTSAENVTSVFDVMSVFDLASSHKFIKTGKKVFLLNPGNW